MLQTSSALGDGSAFRGIFFEEAQEHLAATEAVLLGLDGSEASYADGLNAIFRAVHSIKGSAAMLGFDDVAALAHVMENLLDLLRKGERGLERADIDAMLQAGDVMRAQILHHQSGGRAEDAPDGGPAAAVLRERVADGAAQRPTRRPFRVRLGPLAEPIDAGDLETMLAGLGTMGVLSNQTVDNQAGGAVGFDLELEGTETDLRSVLALVVPPEQIEVTIPTPAAPVAAPARAASASSARVGVLNDFGDEIFVDPAQFRHRREAAKRERQNDTDKVELFVDPEQWRGARKARQPRDEHDVQPSPSAAAARREAATIRVATDKIDQLVNLVGELVITESMLSRQGDLAAARLQKGLADLARHTRNLQDAVLSIRMVPISSVFARFPRVARELAQRLGKEVELKMSGETTELDRALVERISDPLMHLVRNAIDHGLEPPHERVAAGKPPTGVVTLEASHQAGKVVIQVSDDGRGLDRARILARATELGMTVPDDAPDADVWRLIWEPGFSTAGEVTDVSGRGVGMDVVRGNIQALGGTVDLHSRPGQGVTFTVSVPLTLAIMEGMTVVAGGETYVLPLTCIVESRAVKAGEIHSLPGGPETLRVRGDYVPVVRLGPPVSVPLPDAEAQAIAVVVESAGAAAALIVDELPGQQQVVVKNVESNFRKVPGVSGATVMGDGSVALILDAACLVHNRQVFEEHWATARS